MEAEGWFVDPFLVHEERWFSDGRPTPLVRDVGVEGQDAPPSATYPGPLTPIDDVSVGPEDMRRADSVDEPYDPRSGVRAVIDWFVRLPKN